MHSLVQDYITAGGICGFGGYTNTGPPLYNPLLPTTDQCEGYEYDYYNYNYEYPMMDPPESNSTITTGVCSEETVAKLATRECKRELAAQPRFIYLTLRVLMYDMCRPDEIPEPLEGLRILGKQNTDKWNVSTTRNSTDRVSPIGLVLELDDRTLFTNLRPGKMLMDSIF